ncbi:MAG: hypothetical protein KHX84_09600 [Enterocloster asparagiformis]|nr:hypothetical protein [Enterocloster asparagiformis]
MKDTMILKDETIIELESSSSLGDIRVTAPDRTAMLAIWAQLTPDNLSVVQVKNEAGLVAGNYTDLVLDAETSKVAADGTVLTSYHLRPKTDLERLEERVGAVETGQDVQDGAIIELADIVAGGEA